MERVEPISPLAPSGYQPPPPPAPVAKPGRSRSSSISETVFESRLRDVIKCNTGSSHVAPAAQGAVHTTRRQITGHVSVYRVACRSGASVWRPPARREGETMIACKSYLPGGGCVPKLIGIRRGGDCKVEKKKKQTQAVVWRRHRY